MKQIYYTVEGTPYLLKMANKNIVVTPLVGTPIFPQLIFNERAENVDPNSLLFIFVNTDRPVLPLMMNYSVMSNATTPLIAMSTPYYGQISSISGQRIFEYQKGLSKNLANVERITSIGEAASNPLFNRYGLKYNQCVYENGDFISPDIRTSFPFYPSLEFSLNNVVQNLGVIPAGVSYNVSQTFLYFELQKDKM